MTLDTLDDLDRRILEQLQRDSSLTNHALAERVHASPPTCLRRSPTAHREAETAKAHRG